MSQAAKSQIDPLNRKNYGAITAMLTVGTSKRPTNFAKRPLALKDVASCQVRTESPCTQS